MKNRKDNSASLVHPIDDSRLSANECHCDVSLQPDKREPLGLRVNQLRPALCDQYRSEDEDEHPCTAWPVLDASALHGIAGRFVELATRNSEADPAAVLITFLVRVGIEIGPGPVLYVGDTKHYARTFTVIVGATSKARKGTSARPIERLFAPDVHTDICEYTPARVSPGPLSSGEGLIYAVRDEQNKWKDTKNKGKGGWVTIDPGIKDKRLLIIEEEFASALKTIRREGNTLSAIIRSGWDSGTLEPITKINRISAKNAHIGIVGHITMEELNQLFGNVEALNGFGNRFLWICSRRQKQIPFPQPMPDDELEELRSEVIDLILNAQSISTVTMGADARDLWECIYPDLSTDFSGLVGAITNRAEAQVIRLSMIYALLDGKDTISEQHLQSALALWQYAKDSARFLFEDREVSPISQKILKSLSSGCELSRTDINNLFSHNASKRQIQSALKELISSEKISFKMIPTKGREKTVYFQKDKRDKRNLN
jgi:hypothetical protein